MFKLMGVLAALLVFAGALVYLYPHIISFINEEEKNESETED